MVYGMIALIALCCVFYAVIVNNILFAFSLSSTYLSPSSTPTIILSLFLFEVSSILFKCRSIEYDYQSWTTLLSLSIAYISSLISTLSCHQLFTLCSIHSVFLCINNN